MCVSVRVPVAPVNREQQSMGGDTCVPTEEKHTHICPAAVSCLLSLSLLRLCLVIKQQAPPAVNYAVGRTEASISTCSIFIDLDVSARMK